jgi:phospholipase C
MDIPAEVQEVPVTPYSPVLQTEEPLSPTTFSGEASPLPEQLIFTPVEQAKYIPTHMGVKHVIFVMLKNRSFDQMLGCLGQELNLDGVDPQRCNFGSSGVPVFQAPINNKVNQKEFHSGHAATMLQMGDMKDMTGFVETCHKLDEKTQTEFYAGRWEEIMGFFPPGDLPALHTLARNFTVCDKWFSSVPGESVANRLFAFTGTSTGRVNVPNNDEPYEQNQPTIFDRLDESEITWNVYHEGFASSLLLPRQWDDDKVHKYRNMTRFFQDCNESAVQFPEFAFVEPKFGQSGNDDSAPHDVMNGQRLLADIYNAVRGNEELWYSSLIVVLYDQHGGFYDHVSPPEAITPDEHQEEFLFDQLGVRVPALLISPYIDNDVDSTVYDHTSLLAFATSKWGLGALGDRTASADSFEGRINKKARLDCLQRIDGIPHDDTIRSGNITLPFTTFQKEICTVMKKIAETRPNLSHLTNDFSTWSEFEASFRNVLSQHQRADFL